MATDLANGGLINRLRSFIGTSQPPASSVGDQLGGLFRIGALGSYSGQAWYYSRIVNAVYHNPTGKRCTDAIAAAFARAPLTCYAEGDKVRETAKASPLQAILDNPVPMGLSVPAVSGKAAARKRARDMTLAGMHLSLKVRGSGLTEGPLTQLRRLPPQRVTVIGNEHDELLGFIYHDRLGGRMPLLSQWCVYERFPHPDRDYQPFPPALSAGLAAETDTKAARFNLDLLENDGAIPAVVMLEGLTPDNFNAWTTAWEEGNDPGKVRFMGFTGNSSSGKSVEVVKIGQTNQELSYDKLRDYSQEDIARALGCPPVVTFNMSHETYANAGLEIKHWYSSTIWDYWDQSSDEMTSQLGGEFGVALGYDLNAVAELQESKDSLVERYMLLQTNQNMSINETNRRLGFPEVDWGDAPLVPVTVMQPMPPPIGGDMAQPEVPEPPPAAPEPLPPKAALPRYRHRANGLAITPHLPVIHDVVIDLPSAERQEARNAHRLQRFFDRQGRAVTKRLTSPGRDRSTAAILRRGLFDSLRWDAELEEESQAVLDEMADGRGDASAMARNINEQTRRELEDMVTSAMVEGKALPDVAVIVGDYFKARGQDAAAVLKAELEHLQEVTP